MSNPNLLWSDSLPYGIDSFEENVASKYQKGSKAEFLDADDIHCCIRGCNHWHKRRKRGKPCSYCPDHEISVSSSPTYIFKDSQRNYIVGRELIKEMKKVERWRLGNENSEDALTWNAFVGLLKLEGLKSLFELFTGTSPASEPELYLWGNRINTEEPAFWEKLKHVRSELDPKQYQLCRVFNFGRDPRFYILHGSLREKCQLDPVLYRAII